MNYIDTEHRDLPHELVHANYDVIKKYIKDRLSSKQMLTVCSDQYFIVISNDPAAKLSSRISRLSEDLKSMYRLPLLCCIGNEYTNYLDIPKSFNEADTIFRYLDHNRPGVFLYSTINFLHRSAGHISRAYKKKWLAPLPPGKAPLRERRDQTSVCLPSFFNSSESSFLQ